MGRNAGEGRDNTRRVENTRDNSRGGTARGAWTGGKTTIAKEEFAGRLSQQTDTEGFRCRSITGDDSVDVFTLNRHNCKRLETGGRENTTQPTTHKPPAGQRVPLSRCHTNPLLPYMPILPTTPLLPRKIHSIHIQKTGGGTRDGQRTTISGSETTPVSKFGLGSRFGRLGPYSAPRSQI